MGRDSEEGRWRQGKRQEAKIGQLSATSGLVTVRSSEMKERFPLAAHCTVSVSLGHVLGRPAESICLASKDPEEVSFRRDRTYCKGLLCH